MTPMVICLVTNTDAPPVAVQKNFYQELAQKIKDSTAKSLPKDFLVLYASSLEDIAEKIAGLDNVTIVHHCSESMVLLGLHLNATLASVAFNKHHGRNGCIIYSVNITHVNSDIPANAIAEKIFTYGNPNTIFYSI